MAKTDCESHTLQIRLKKSGILPCRMAQQVKKVKKRRAEAFSRKPQPGLHVRDRLIAESQPTHILVRRLQWE
jgi:hypothetical protein